MWVSGEVGTTIIMCVLANQISCDDASPAPNCKCLNTHYIRFNQSENAFRFLDRIDGFQKEICPRRVYLKVPGILRTVEIYFDCSFEL